jgi:hemolysin activation/secretion protein
MKFLVLILGFIFLQISSEGQKSYSAGIVLSDSLPSYLKDLQKEINGSKNFKDTFQVFKQFETVLFKLRTEGYLAAGIDSIHKDSTRFTAFIFSGQKYLWGQINQGNVPSELFEGTGFRKKLFSGKPFRYNQISQLNEKIIRNCENNGYPFATLTFDSIRIIENRFYSSLSLNKNRFVKIDSIIIKGSATIAPVYIYNYIGIQPGDSYNESQIKKISSRMRELPFIKELKSSQILFNEKETKLFLFLENKKASQFDGIIGFLPDESKSGKLNITGEVHLKLQNSLKRGEIIEFNWKQLPVKSQDLKVRALYPFLFNTSFGIDGNLAIFKKDTTYIDVTKNVGIQYALSGNNYLKVFINDKQSDLQSVKGLENVTILPEFADITTVSYGGTVHYEKLDYRLNPRHGFSLEATGSAGNRKIRRNSEINKSVYDSIRLNSVSYHAELNADYFISPGGRHVLVAGTIAGYIYNPNLFVNELFRIGGLKSLRGFDEESIFASQYAIGKLEYRYLLDQNSFLFTFFNMAWYKNKSRNRDINDTPWGFGTGINFETKLGIMSVSYALGKQFDNPIFLKNGKIHFGIVNYF